MTSRRRLSSILAVAATFRHVRTANANRLLSSSANLEFRSGATLCSRRSVASSWLVGGGFCHQSCSIYHARRQRARSFVCNSIFATRRTPDAPRSSEQCLRRHSKRTLAVIGFVRHWLREMLRGRSWEWRKRLLSCEAAACSRVSCVRVPRTRTATMRCHRSSPNLSPW